MSRVVAAAIAVAALLPAAALAGTSAQDCRATPNTGVGGLSVTPPLRAKIGTGHVLSGTVLSALSCRPIAGARVEFRQAGPNGEYAPRWTGAVLTSSAGRFRIQGPVPGDYGRGPHIHLEVRATGYEPLAYTHMVPTGSKGATLRLVLVPVL